MEYSREEFYDLMEAVENAGGEHLDRLCTATRYEFVGDHQKPVTYPGCGESALFNVPYEQGTTSAPVIGVVEVCAVEDEMGRWPRFGGDRFGKNQT